MAKKSGYEGKVSHQGAQVIRAPHAESGTKGGKVIRGEDLRGGKQGK